MTPVLTQRKIIWDDDPVDIKPLKHAVARRIDAPELVTNKKKVKTQGEALKWLPLSAALKAKENTIVSLNGKACKSAESGNGHRFTAKRPLTENERTLIRRWWLKRGGIVTTNDVVNFRKLLLPDDVGIFQIGGYISVLHRALARGELTIANIQAYNKNRKSRGQSWISGLTDSQGFHVCFDPHPKFVTIAKEKAKKYHPKYTA